MGLRTRSEQLSERPGADVAPGPVVVRRRVLALVTALVLIAAVATAAAVGIWRGLPDLPDLSVVAVAGLLVTLVVAGMLNVEYAVRGHRDAFDSFEAALLPALHLLPPVQVVLLAVLAKACCQALRRVPPTKAVFNVAQWGAATAVAALLLAALRGPADWPELGALLAAVAALVVVNTLAVLAVLTVVQGRAAPTRAAALLSSTAGSAAVSTALGLGFVAAPTTPEAVVVLLVPLLVLHWASRGYANGQVVRAHREAASAVSTALSDAAVPGTELTAFVGAVGQALDRDAVDLVTEHDTLVRVQSWRRYAGVSHTVLPRHRLSPLLRDLLTRTDPVRADLDHGEEDLRRLLRADGREDVAAAPVPSDGRQAGVLVLSGARSPVPWPDRELDLVHALAREVGVALERDALLSAVLGERAKLSRIVDETGDGIVTLGPDGRVETWNRALADLTGYRPEEVVGTTLDVLDLRDVQGRSVDLGSWVHDRQDPPADVLARTRSGEQRWLSCSYARGRGARGLVDQLVVVARDVTELKHVQSVLSGQTAVLESIASGRPLRHSLQLLAEQFVGHDEGAGSAVLLSSRTDPTQLSVVASAGVARDVLDQLLPLHVATVARWAAHPGPPEPAPDVVRYGTDGERRLPGLALVRGIRSLSVVPIRAPHGDRVIGAVSVQSRRAGSLQDGTHRDVLERTAQLAAVAIARSEYEAELAHQATHDALTGLANRAILMDRCEHALRTRDEDTVAALLFVDLDQFKAVNDTMGHDAGDQLLVEVAQRLRRLVRPGDTVARFGGDEFIVLCDSMSTQSAVADLAERVLGVFAHPFDLGGATVFVTASVGVATGRRGDDADDLVSDADAAMYRAKEDGGNRFEVHTEDMRRPLIEGLVTPSALRRALDQDELELLYQPIVSLRSGNVVGTEALLRWRHPELGLLGPEAFLPQAESTGLIVPMGAYVVGAACEQAQRWQTAGASGRPLRMNINLSARELGHPGLTRTVAGALASSGASPDTVCFEITESSVLKDVEATTTTLRQLKDLGVGLAIDDFGTGYSPLTYLRRFPVDELKIDRSFVAGLDTDSGDRAIVTAVLGLARSLRLATVGEGVETASQLASLHALGCQAAQGYYLARPGPAEDVVPHARTALPAGR